MQRMGVLVASEFPWLATLLVNGETTKKQVFPLLPFIDFRGH